MPKLPNPNSSKQFEKIYKDDSGNPEYGERTVDGLKEVVNLKTGESNMQYHQPEMVLNPKGCKHEFQVVSMGKREFICDKCNWGVTVNVSNIKETDNEMTIYLKQGRYLVK